jgi:hypothetical protein
MAIACRQVELSGQAGPEAIMSSGSPKMSESTMEYTCAGGNQHHPTRENRSLQRTLYRRIRQYRGNGFWDDGIGMVAQYCIHMHQLLDMLIISLE